MTQTNKPVWQWSAHETLDAISNREISVTKVVTEVVERMRALNPDINAITEDMGDKALRLAKEADEKLASGEAEGALFGLPITIKHNVDVAGFANSNGVPAMQGLIATEDAPLVERLRAAGAIVIGLTNVPEFSLRAMTDNPIYGRTENPWDKEVTCGGSSGGAGAALACGMGSLAHGNDIGGSLRWPAYCNGVYAIRPTLGRVPAYNASAASERSLIAQLMSVQGPMARTVDDLKLGLEIMEGFDARDPWSVPAPLNGNGRELPEKVAMVKLDSIKNLVPEVRASLLKTAETLEANGYVVQEVDMPDWDKTLKLWFNLMGAEIKTLTWDMMQTVGSDAIKAALEGYFNLADELDLKGYMEQMAARTGILREWLAFLEDYPLILAPVSTQGSIKVDADLAGNDAISELTEALKYTTAINLLGLPSIVVPIDVVDNKPVGVQLIATRYREDMCLDAAKSIETALGEFYKRFNFPV